MSKCPADFNFFDENVLNCPHDFYQTPQEPAPEVTAIYATAWQPVDTMITADPPRHKTYRTLVNKVLSASRVNAMEDYMKTIVH